MRHISAERRAERSGDEHQYAGRRHDDGLAEPWRGVEDRVAAVAGERVGGGPLVAGVLGQPVAPAAAEADAALTPFLARDNLPLAEGPDRTTTSGRMRSRRKSEASRSGTSST